MLFNVDWGQVFLPSAPIIEMVVRGSLVYLILFALLRFILKRETGTVGITDLLVVVLIADAAQNAMASDYTSITDGLVLVATIICWSYALEWLGYRFPQIQRLLRPPPLPLVRDGHMLRRNLRSELITPEELMSQLRQQGLDDLSQVKVAYMEGDGRISVIARDGVAAQGAPERRAL